MSLHRHNIKRRAEELVYKTHLSRQELGSGPFRPAEGSRITALAEPRLPPADQSAFGPSMRLWRQADMLLQPAKALLELGQQYAMPDLR